MKTCQRLNWLHDSFILDEHAMRDLLTLEVEHWGSQAALASKLGISTSWLNDLLRGKKPVSLEVAERLGMERITVFVRRDE